ncbi:molybdenum cofactor biosynthesis protein A, partial [Yasminevirus sp. GU-2018]
LYKTHMLRGIKARYMMTQSFAHADHLSKTFSEIHKGVRNFHASRPHVSMVVKITDEPNNSSPVFPLGSTTERSTLSDERERNLVLSRVNTPNYGKMLQTHNALRASYKSEQKELLDVANLDHFGTFTKNSKLLDFEFVNDHVKSKQDRNVSSDYYTTRDSAIKAWIRTHRFYPKNDEDSSQDIFVTSGVRNSIELLMRTCKNNTSIFGDNCVFHVPSDIYPVYEQIAQKVKIVHKVYKTIPVSGSGPSYEEIFPSQFNTSTQTDDFLERTATSEVAIIALPAPLSADYVINGGYCPPTVSSPTVTNMIEWLARRQNRYIVIDSVYAHLYDSKLDKLLQTSRVFYLNSLSKSHCSPNMFGVCVAPKNILRSSEFNSDTIRETVPLQVLLKSATLMHLYPQSEMMRLQLDSYSKAWRTVNDRFVKLGVISENSFNVAIVNNYIKLCRTPNKELISRDVLAVPMNVYARPDLDEIMSVVSCLEYVPEHINGASKTMYHLTTLSNFVRGYDKYSNTFIKTLIPESTFPDKFHLLTEDDINIGVEKTKGLLTKLSIRGDTFVLIETRVDPSTQIFRSDNGNEDYLLSDLI